MSATEEEAANTGIVPPAPSGNENAFENVNVGSENTSAAAAETLGEVGSSEPVESLQEASANVNASVNASVVPTISAMSKSGKPMSAKQSDLQRLRSETLEDMREKYSERFGNSSMYPKPPKAKAYHASGLTSIRQRNGEEAYKTALNRIMDANDPLKRANSSSTAAANSSMGRNMFKTTAKKGKSKKNATMNASANASANSFMPSQLSAAANSSMNRGSTNTIIQSIETMGSSAKGLIDTMISTSKALARELAKTGNVSAMSQLASVANNSARSTAKPKRSRAKRSTQKASALSSIPEETSVNMDNSSALAPVNSNM